MEPEVLLSRLVNRHVQEEAGDAQFRIKVDAPDIAERVRCRKTVRVGWPAGSQEVQQPFGRNEVTKDLIRDRRGQPDGQLLGELIAERTGRRAEGKDLRRHSLEQRKIELDRLLAGTEFGLVFNEWIDGGDCDGATVFEHARSLGLEGIVSKRKDLRYVSGRSPYWLKMKNPESAAARRETEEDWGR